MTLFPFCGKMHSVLRQNALRFAAKCIPFCGKMHCQSDIAFSNFIRLSGSTQLKSFSPMMVL